MTKNRRNYPILKKVKSKRSAKKQLLAFFLINGYIRSPDKKRRKLAGSMKYKKGWEVRFVIKTKVELKLIRNLLNIAGFKPKKPFKKNKKIVQPVYGKDFIEWLHK